MLSSRLFHLYMDVVVRKVNKRINTRGLQLNGDGKSWVLSQLLFLQNTTLASNTEIMLPSLAIEF